MCVLFACLFSISKSVAIALSLTSSCFVFSFEIECELPMPNGRRFAPPPSSQEAHRKAAWFGIEVKERDQRGRKSVG